LSGKIHLEQDAFIALTKGNEQGLDFFFNRYYSPLVFYSISLTKSQEAAQEIASEAFIKLWKNRESIAEYRKVKFLLYRIVYNASIDFIREQKSRQKFLSTLNSISAPSQSSVLENLIEIETHHRIYLLLSHLPTRCRQVFQMFYLEDKPVKEIAKELGISVNTVKSQKQRAVQLLKEKQAALFLSIIAILLFLPH
jgi:RNA polymerase sigma-70 factor (ECF subfamily)